MRALKYILGIGVALIIVLAAIFYLEVHITEPDISAEAELNEQEVTQINPNHYQIGANQLLKNDKGIWEMYLEGGAYERGEAFGALGYKLMKEKETAFIGEIKNRIPSESYLNFLKVLVGWVNRDLDEYVPEEQLLEIYGSSQSMADSFDFVGPKFHRSLSYHAAHDIGHALQNMNLVGCTSFASWGNKSEGNKLLIGRNFDFYFGENFAQDKIIAFYRPDNGYQFMSVTWAGFSGVVSGMNEKGLTVTLNSAKSDIPTKGKTPVSLIARQILQYASTIQEAYDIADSFDSFVAETFLIGSKADGKVGLIEKSTGKTDLYLSEGEEMVVTNHFQGKALLDDPLNQEYVREEVSTYRYQRVEQLIDSLAPLNPNKIATILRDKKGLDDKDIGLGNEKAINQLIAHHSVIFSPDDMVAWVSCAPYQLGDYLAYDLKEIFAEKQPLVQSSGYADTLSLPADPFLATPAYQKFAFFAKTRDRIQHYLFAGKGEPLTNEEVSAFEKSNENSFLTYYYLGDYFKSREEWQKAKHYYEIGLTKEIARKSERKHMEEGLSVCTEHLNP
ncbi:C45 family autoproteolytic acyltransferase/hydolase [Catalinimonas niigatensis]|uniref:C45 family autoproteolytic acyltransferase/hydolase n=1 Tax=Catalinimonas niigatensis TaxID=1397264 RepID=UPI002665F4C0|nr:C45 family peptidase [Catalinimonas niigatensis]WPP48776.1 C45 family peptidase [Catalinimonas niigatensis]